MDETGCDYSNTIIDKLTAVTAYGSKGQKNFYEKNKKLNPPSEKGLMKTLDQHYDSVEKVKVGRAFHYSLGNKRNKVAIREDKRTFLGVRGHNALPYTLSMDIYVASALQAHSVSRAQSYNRWMRDLDIISYTLYELMSSRFQPKLRAHMIQTLIRENIIEDESDRTPVNDFLSAINELTKQFENSVQRLSKINAIESNTSHYAMFKRIMPTNSMKPDDDEVILWESAHISESEYLEHQSFKSSLMEQYGVTHWEANNLIGKPSVSLYLNALKYSYQESSRKYEDIQGYKSASTSLQYYYTKHWFQAVENKDAVETYLKSYAPDLLDEYLSDKSSFIDFHINEFHKGRYQRVKELTDKKMTKRINKVLGSMKMLGVKRAKGLSLSRYRLTIDSLQFEYRSKKFRGGIDDNDEFNRFVKGE